MTKKSLFRILRIVMTAMLIGYALYKSQLFTVQGWRDLFQIFAQISLPYLLASLAIGMATNLSSSIKWYMLLRARGIRVSLWRVIGYYMVGKFFNLVLPTSLGGDVIRMTELARYTGRYADSVASVVVERFTGMVTLIVLGLIAAFLNARVFNLPGMTAALIVGVAGAAGMTWLVLDRRPFQIARRLAGPRLPFLDGIFRKIVKFQNAVLAYKDAPGAILWAVINSLVFNFLAVVNVWVTTLALGSRLTFIELVVAVPIILLIMNLPISIGGIGLMEFAYSFVLALFGAPAAIGLSTALIMRAKNLIYAGLGGLIYPVVSDGASLRERALGDPALAAAGSGEEDAV